MSGQENIFHIELRSELAKENPDPGKVAELQDKLSGLEAKLDQKHVEHLIKMRKLNPNAGRGFMGATTWVMVTPLPITAGNNIDPYLLTPFSQGGYDSPSCFYFKQLSNSFFQAQ